MGVRILALWPPDRPDLTAPFDDLAASDDAATTYLTYGEGPPRSQRAAESHGSVVSLRDVFSVDTLLDSVNPDVVIVQELGWLPCMVVSRARRRGIPVALLQHGVQQRSIVYRRMQKRGRRRPGHGARSDVLEPERNRLDQARQAAVRLWRSDHLRTVTQLPLMVVRESLHTLYPYSQLAYLASRHAWPPDYFLIISRALAPQTLDEFIPPADRVFEVGLPWADAVLSEYRSLNHPHQGEQTLLLVDTPNVDNWQGRSTMDLETKRRLAESLLQAAVRRRLTLTIRLHPHTTNTSWVPSHPRVTTVSGGSLAGQLFAAQSVVGFNSTALIPAIATRPTILIEDHETPLTDLTKKLGVGAVIRLRAALDPEGFNDVMQHVKYSQVASTQFVRKALGSSKADAVDRLRASIATIASKHARRHDRLTRSTTAS